MNSLSPAIPSSGSSSEQSLHSSAERTAVLEELVSQVRQKEAALLNRSLRNLKILKPALVKEKGDHLVPCVLSSFSVSLVATGTFLNACMAHGRLLIHHADGAISAVTNLAESEDELLGELSSWRYLQAGVPMPWLDMQLAEILAAAEVFDEWQRELVVPHICTANKIMDVSRMLADTQHSLVVAIWAYITNDFTVEFARNMVEDLMEAIDVGPEKLHQLSSMQCLVVQKINDLGRQIREFKATGQLPVGVEAVSAPDVRKNESVTKARALLRDHVKEIATYRASLAEFDRAMSVMANGLPSFVRSLLKFVNVWNRDAAHSLKP